MSRYFLEEDGSIRDMKVRDWLTTHRNGYTKTELKVSKHDRDKS